jgi:hypothetical protein
MDDGLGHPVAGCSFATKDGYPRCKLLALVGAHSFDFKIAVDDTQDVHLLTLVLVYALYLDIEQCFRVDFDAGSLHDVLCQTDLVGIFDFLPFLLEGFIIEEVLELIQFSQISQEIIASKLRRDQFAEPGIGLVQPPSRCDTIGYVGELIRTVDLDKVLENGGLDEVGVKLGYTIDFMASNGRQVSHSHHLWLGLFDDGDTREHVTILGELLLNHLEELHIDLVDDLEMPW